MSKWTAVQNGTGTSYAVRQAVSNLSLENGATVTLYAQWEPNTYKIVFDKNNQNCYGTQNKYCNGTMSDQNMTYGMSSQLYKNAFYRARDFDSWNTEPDGTGTKYADQEAVSNLASNNGAIVTLYAQWKLCKKGDLAYSDGSRTSPSEYDNTKTLLGVVFDSAQGVVYIAHLKQSESKAWCLQTADGYGKNIALSPYNGTKSWENICDAVNDEDIAGNYPAFEYVNSLTEGGRDWYLPTSSTMTELLSIRNTINTSIQTLKGKGVDADLLVEASYWTSNSSNYEEYGQYPNAIVRKFDSSGNIIEAITYKHELKNVRAVKLYEYEETE